ncbi:MAG: phosphatase PAP2 family protein [Bacteroidota bacterium]
MAILSAFWETIKLWDQTTLFHINQVWSNKTFDAVLPWLRESATWLPLYLFYSVFALANFGKRGAAWVIFFLICVTISDQVSNYFKHWIERPRPCNDPFMAQYIRLRLEYCSPSFSFTSSHAANHFGVAMFIHFTMKNIKPIKTSWLFLWAFTICYAQMYVGIHYPTDILGGTLIGLFAGWIASNVFNRRFKLLQINPVY